MLLAALAAAQQSPPDLTKGGTSDGRHDWNLGPTGARGWMWGRDLSTADARQILVMRVDRGSPAESALEVGDVLLGVDGAPFASDARKLFGAAITRAETTKNRGVLKLLRWRRGTTSAVEIRLAPMGDYSDASPAQCAKSATLVDRACRHLLEKGLGDGIAGEINALGLLATGRAECLEPVRALAREVARKSRKLDLGEGMAAWTWGYANLFLTEYYLSTGDAEVLPAIRAYSTKIAEGQSAVGTWGHGMSLPRHAGGLGGYGAINQSGMGCWLSLILAQKCGVNDAIVKEAIERSRRFFVFYVGKGSIPYGDHAPYFYLHDNNGKNAMAAIAFDLLGDDEAARFFSRMSTAAYDERELGHTGNYFGYLWGPLGVARAGGEAVAAHLREQRWFYDLARASDGGFVYQGGAGEADSYENWDTTGIHLLTLSLPLKKLYITGKGARDANALEGAALRGAIEDGRLFDPRRMHECYAGLADEELLGRLRSASPAVRYRAANALAVKKSPVIPQLTEMLSAADRDARYGACQALERIGSRAAPARARRSRPC